MLLNAIVLYLSLHLLLLPTVTNAKHIQVGLHLACNLPVTKQWAL